MAHLDLQRGTYDAARALLGKRASRRIGHNTRLEDRGAYGLAVRYHATVIYRMMPDGSIIARTGGYWTVTTLARLNALLPGPWRLGSNRGVPTLYHSGYPVAPFHGSIIIYPDGAIGETEGARAMTSKDVRDAVQAGQDRRAMLDERRTARLLREHPTANLGAETGPHRGYAGRSWHCARCQAETAYAHERERERLGAEHDIAARLLQVTEPPTLRDVERLRLTVGEPWTLLRDHIAPDWMSGRERLGERVAKFVCPWECPKRDRSRSY